MTRPARLPSGWCYLSWEADGGQNAQFSAQTSFDAINGPIPRESDSSFLLVPRVDEQGIAPWKYIPSCINSAAIMRQQGFQMRDVCTERKLACEGRQRLHAGPPAKRLKHDPDHVPPAPQLAWTTDSAP